MNRPAWSRLLANGLAAVAQFETEVRVERILVGQAAAKAKGKCWGGSRKGERRKITNEQISVIRNMGFDRKSISSIARATGLSRPTVYAVLRDASLMVPAESPAGARCKIAFTKPWASRILTRPPRPFRAKGRY